MSSTERARGLRSALRSPRAQFFGPLLLLAALLVFNFAFTPGFASITVRDGGLFGAVIDILQNASPVLLLAVGMTVVVSMGGIDLSVGSVMALCGAAAALLMVERGWGFAGALAGAVALGGACGVVNGAMVRVAGLQPIVATLVSLIALRGLAQTMTGDQKVPFSDSAFLGFANGSFLFVPVPLYVAGAVAVAASLVLRRTAPGMQAQAIGDSPVAAGYCGLPITRVTLGAYGFCGACAALAGLIAAGDIGEADVATGGQYLELDAILAVVIGGTPLTGGRARLWGSLVGALVMQTLTTTLRMHGIGTQYTLVMKGAVVLAVCLVQAPAAAGWARGLWAARQGRRA